MPTDTTTLFDAIQAFAEEGVEHAIDADRDVSKWWELHKQLTHARFLLAQAIGTVEDAIADVIGDSTVPLRDGGSLRVRYSAKSPKWDGESIVSRLTALALDERQIDRETGEALESEAAAVSRVLCRCAPLLTPSFNWRAGELKKALGELDELRTVEGWTRKVVCE